MYQVVNNTLDDDNETPKYDAYSRKCFYQPICVGVSLLVAAASIAFAIIISLHCHENANQTIDQDSNSVLLLGGTVVTMNEECLMIKDGFVAIRHGLIVGIGNSADLSDDFARIAPTLRLKDTDIVMPGFINAHTHASMSLLRGVADDLSLMTWLNDYMWPAEHKLMSPEFVSVGAKLAALEMLRGGTTMFADNYFWEKEVAKVVHDVGMRAVLGQTVMHFENISNSDMTNMTDLFDYIDEFMTDYAHHPLIVPAVSPHAPYSVTTEFLQRSKQVADKFNSLMLIHCSETTAESAQIAKRFEGQTPTQYLESIAVLGENVVCAHSIHLTDEDIKIYENTGTKVVHCPESNMKLGSGIARIEYMTVNTTLVPALGTDGPSSNNDLDMISEMASAGFLQKVNTGKASALPAMEILKMATINGAKALGVDKLTGSLEIGKSGDVAVVSGSGVSHIPAYNPLTAVVYESHSLDVYATIVNGRILYHDGLYYTIDTDSVFESVKKYMPLVCDAVVGKRPFLCSSKSTRLSDET